MMKIIYRNEYEGDDNFSKLIHKLATECEACIAVRNRRKILLKEITQVNGKILFFSKKSNDTIVEAL